MEISDILKNLFMVIDRKNVKSVIWYGNRGGRDIDLLVITNKPSQKEYVRDWRNLDARILTRQEMMVGIDVMDPLATEPLITGREIYGDTNEFWKQYRKAEMEWDNFNMNYRLNYLVIRAGIYYDWANEHWLVGAYKECALTLSFAQSHLDYISYFKRFSRTTYLQNLLMINKDPLLEKTIKLAKSTNEHHEAKLQTKLAEYIRKTGWRLKRMQKIVK